MAVIPAQAGIQVRLVDMDPRVRGDDGPLEVFTASRFLLPAAPQYLNPASCTLAFPPVTSPLPRS